MSLLSSVSIVDFELVNICRGALSCVNIITQSLMMSRCSIQHHSKYQNLSKAKISKYLPLSSDSTYFHEKGFPAILPKVKMLQIKCEYIFFPFHRHSSIS